MEYNFDNAIGDEGNGVLMAQQYREKGHEILAKNSRFLDQLERKAKMSKKHPHNITMTMLNDNPDAVAYMSNYVQARGYTPSDNVQHLAMQMAHAQNEHVEEVMDKYDPDNFSLSTAAGRERRRRRREARRHKHDGDINIDTPVDTPTTADDHHAVNETSVVGDPVNQQMDALAAPSYEDAHAEIIGEQFCGDGYDEQQENYMPFVAAAINMGKDIIGAAKNKDLSFKTLGNIFKKNTNDTVEVIKEKETKNAIKDNMPWALLAVVVLIYLGSQMGKG